MTTTATTESRTRKREPICPPWCDGHNEDGYQSWEVFDEGPARYHAHDWPDFKSEVAHFAAHNAASLSVGLVQFETPTNLSETTVSLLVGNDCCDITLDQARAYAAAVLEAVELAERDGLRVGAMSTSTQLPVLFTVVEVARALRTTNWDVFLLIESGQLAATKPGRCWLIEPAAIRDYLATGR